jgi:hypothetical protein
LRPFFDTLRQYSGRSFALWCVGVFLCYFSARSLDLSFLSILAVDLSQAQWAIEWMNAVKFLSAFTTALLIAAATWRLGCLAFTVMGFQAESVVLRYCFETALGVLLLDALWMGLGLNGLWFDALVFSILLLFVLWSFMGSLKGPGSGRFIPPKTDLRNGLWLGLLASVFISLQIFQIWTPATYFDGLVYHLSTLSFWRFHHGLAPEPGNFFTSFPFGGELYLLNGFWISGSSAAKALNILFFLWAALTAGAWVGEERGSAAGFLTGLSILFLPLFSTTAWSAQNDAALVFFMLLFFYAFHQATLTGSRNWFLLAGLMAGGACAVKETALLGLAVAVLMSLAGKPKGAWKEWGLFMTAALFSVGPWLLKNQLYMGNPVYPYLSQWFGGRIFSETYARALMTAHESPWVLDGSVGQWMTHIFTQSLDRTAAPLLLAFVPFWVLSRTARPWLFGSALLYLVLSFGVSHQLRLALPAVALLLTAMGLALDGPKARWWSWVVLSFGILSFISLFRVSVDYFQWDKMALGVLSEKAYLGTNPQTRTYFGLTESVGKLVPAGDRMLLVGDSRSLYYPRDFVANSLYDPQVLAVIAREEKNGEGVYHRLREMGIDELVISGEEGRRLSDQTSDYSGLTKEEWGRLDQLIQNRTDLVDQEGFWAIYRLRPEVIHRPHSQADLLLALKSQVSKP